MIEKNIGYFEIQSFQDRKISLETFRLARERALGLGVKRMVTPSSSGETALTFAEFFNDTDLELIVVSDRAGVKFSKQEYEKYAKRLLPRNEAEELLSVIGMNEKGHYDSGLSWKPEVVAELLEKGVKVVVASEPFRAMLRSRVNPTFVVAETLSLFGKGVKVAIEVVLAACDAWFLEAGEEVIALGGLTTGVDTALVVRACHRDEMFSGIEKGLQIREIICKPRLT
jgi:hypothetical protein